MRSIQECFEDSRSIQDMINQENVNEGLSDVIRFIKNKFEKVVGFLKGVVAKIGNYFMPVDDNGVVQPAISPLTAGHAYKTNIIRKDSTFVHMDKEGSKIVGLRNKPADAQALYGPGNSIQYWKRMIKECQELSGIPVNEVKLQNSDASSKYNVVDTPALKKLIKVRFQHPKLPPLLIWGAPGIGKTAILMSVLAELPGGDEYSLIVKTLSNETPDNFTLPKYVEVEGQSRATDIPKTWLPVYHPTGDAAQDAKLDAACGKGLLFIDELSRATQQVLNVCLPLINERMFNGWKLGSGWVVIAASNRMEDEMSGQSEMGNAMANRFAQVYYEPTVNSWKEWATTQGYMSPLLLQWLSLGESESYSGAKYFYMDPNEDSDGSDYTKLMCTPRAWTNAMKELALYAHTGSLEGFTIFEIPSDIISLTLNQYVPSEAVDSFMAFLEVVGAVQASQGSFDVFCENVWKKGKSASIKKTDLYKILVPLSQLLITSHQTELPTDKEFENLCDWLIAQDSEQLASFTLDTFKHIFYAGVKMQEIKDAAPIIIEKIKRGLMEPQHLKLWEESLKPVFQKYGVSLDTMPNYFNGMVKLSKKYGAIFKAASLNGINGL